MIRHLHILCFLFCACFVVCAQEVADEGTWQTTEEIQTADSLRIVTQESDKIVVLSADAWKPDPMHAVWMSVILPGYGQIYNRSYWKLPIVYGGFMGCAYAIMWTNNNYQDYKTAYRDILTDTSYDPTDPTKSYVAILPNGYTVERMGGKSAYTRTLNNAQNSYRRYRDISIVATVIVYALSLIDAYVDAQLYDFDISPDLSLNAEPVLYYDRMGNRSAEMRLAIRF